MEALENYILRDALALPGRRGEGRQARYKRYERSRWA